MPHSSLPALKLLVQLDTERGPFCIFGGRCCRIFEHWPSQPTNGRYRLRDECNNIRTSWNVRRLRLSPLADSDIHLVGSMITMKGDTAIISSERSTRLSALHSRITCRTCRGPPVLRRSTLS